MNMNRAATERKIRLSQRAGLLKVDLGADFKCKKTTRKAMTRLQFVSADIVMVPREIP